MIIEILGVIGFGFLIASFTQKDMDRLRILNSIGAVFLTAQALLIPVWSLVLINLSIMSINIYHLVKKDKKVVDLI